MTNGRCLWLGVKVLKMCFSGSLPNFNLTAGNAGNIIVSIDGVVKGKVGKLGEVVESLIIDSNFNK